MVVGSWGWGRGLTPEGVSEEREIFCILMVVVVTSLSAFVNNHRIFYSKRCFCGMKIMLRFLKMGSEGTFLVAQWLNSELPMQGAWGSIPGQGTTSPRLQLKILCATTKTCCSQISFWFFFLFFKKEKVKMGRGIQFSSSLFAFPVTGQHSVLKAIVLLGVGVISQFGHPECCFVSGNRVNPPRMTYAGPCLSVSCCPPLFG